MGCTRSAPLACLRVSVAVSTAASGRGGGGAAVAGAASGTWHRDTLGGGSVCTMVDGAGPIGEGVASARAAETAGARAARDALIDRKGRGPPALGCPLAAASERWRQRRIRRSGA